MPYPETWLTRPVRRAMMATLIASFFIISPTVLFYTAGYRYIWSEHRLSGTGVMSINFLPRDAHVYVNGVEITDRPPLHLSDRAPGTYHIVIQKDGYLTWEKDIKIEGQKTTFIKNISLWRKAAPIAATAYPNANGLSVSPDGLSILIDRSAGASSWLIHPTTGAADILLSFDKGSATNTSFSWSSSGHELAFFGPPLPTSTITLFSTENQDAKVWSLGRETVVPHVEWQTNDNTPTLYVQAENDIYILRENTKQFFATVPTNTPWFVDASAHLWTFALEKHRLIRHDDTTQAVGTPAGLGVKQIIDINASRAIVDTTEGTAVILRDRKQYTVVMLPSGRWRYNQFTKEWLIWSPSELWTVYDHGEPALLNRTSEKIIDVWPLDSHGVLLVATDHAFLAFNPGYYVSQELWRGDGVTEIGVSQKNRQIYFFGTVNKHRGMYTFDY